MKFVVISALVVVALCALIDSASAYPQLLDLQFENEPQNEGVLKIDEELSNLGLRQKRVTCDLLSFSTKIGELNHAACAANCLRLGRRGGSCNNGVCVCRK